MPRDNLVPLGLITAPGKLGVMPQGALAVAENVLLRVAGQLERVRDTFDEGSTSFGAPTPLIVLPIPSSTYLGFFDGGTGERTLWGSTLDLFSDVVLGVTLRRLAGRAFAFLARNRYMMNTQQGIVVHDFLTPVTSPQRRPRAAGFAPTGCIAFTSASATGFAPPGVNASWCVVLRRTFADGYVVQSPPSVQALIATTVQSNFSIGIYFPETATAGDTVELYRTVTRPTGTDPGSQFYLVGQHTITAGEITAGSYSFLDTVPDTSLGRDLYTNEGVEGADQTDDQPPYAETVATHKGFGFYANLKQLPSYTGSMPIRFTEITTDERATAIGMRRFSCSANASAVITAISAADMVGLQIGQTLSKLSGAGTLVGTTTILAVGATTLTVNPPLTGTTGPAVLLAQDMAYFNTGAATQQSGSLATPSILPFTFRGLVSLQTDRLANGYLGGSSNTVQLTIAAADFLRGTLNLAITNGRNMSPPVLEPLGAPPSPGVDMSAYTGELQPNALMWSKDQKPEAVPPLQITRVGAGTIYKLEATTDALWIFASDGLWKLTGAGGDWRVDLVDPSVLLATPGSTCIYRDQVYAYTNRGVVSVDASSGLKADISDSVIGDLLPPSSLFSGTASNVILAPHEYYDEVWFSISATGGAKTFFVYNVVTQGWTQVLFPATPDTVYVVGYDRARSRLLYGIARSAAAAVVTSLRTDTPSTFSKPARVEFQPLYSGQPGTTKQWISAEYVFDALSDTLTIVPTFSGVDNPAIALRSRGQGDARVSSYVPRAAFAMNQSIRTGWKAADTAQRRFYGVFPRLSPGSEQELQR